MKIILEFGCMCGFYMLYILREIKWNPHTMLAHRLTNGIRFKHLASVWCGNQNESNTTYDYLEKAVWLFFSSLCCILLIDKHTHAITRAIHTLFLSSMPAKSLCVLSLLRWYIYYVCLYGLNVYNSKAYQCERAVGMCVCAMYVLSCVFFFCSLSRSHPPYLSLRSLVGWYFEMCW